MAEEAVTVGVDAPVEDSVVETVTPVSSDLKRKLDDLEPKEASSDEPVVSNPPPSDLPKEELNVKSDEVDNSVPESKRPRLEEESDGSALENGHEVEKLDLPGVENATNTTGANDEAENAQNKTAANDEAENAQITTAGNVEADNGKDATVENLEMENVEQNSMENPSTENVQQSSDENLKTADVQHSSGGDLQQSTTGIPQQADLSSLHQPVPEIQSMTRKMEVPNNKVGVLIGKAGDTIRFLQLNSGAKIQITRDAEADPYSSTRPVELIGTLENIDKAERLIKDVIAEADAGGSPSLVARGFGTVQASGPAEHIQIQVPNEKVGLIIGKGGETIKNLQTRSGARIQLIPQHLPEGDQSKERTVKVSGDKKQIELARDMIKEVMNQPVRSSSLSGGYNQQNYRPRGPSGPPQWGPRAPTAQGTGYDYPQRGMYPSQNPQYMPPAYGGYPQQQTAPRSNFNAGWDQRPSAPMQSAPPQSGGYDYYAQGGHGTDASAPAPVSNSGAVPAAALGAAPAHMNYNYGNPQGPEYGQPTTYPQSVPSQQSYGHGYEDPKYANQVSAQPGYGGHGNAQPGAYPQQVGTQSGYGQQPYSKPPTYGMPSQGPAPQSYGPPRTSQPGEVPYQNPISSAQSYGPAGPSQQPYPYASSGPTQQTYPYGSAPAANDGYNQPPTHTGPAPVYPQQGGQSGYGQPGGQVAPGYAQGGQAGGYGPYAASQPGYGEQSVPNNASYGYQAPADTGYGSAPTSAYGAPANYVQPTSNQPAYEQPTPQSGGYVSGPGSAPGYVKNLSPQPVYGQYDASQMYGGHH